LRLHVVERLPKHVDRLLLEALADDVERSIKDAFGSRLLAGVHDRVRELSDELVLELRVRNDLPLGDFATTGHLSSLRLRALDTVLRAFAVAVRFVRGARPRCAGRV